MCEAIQRLLWMVGSFTDRSSWSQAGLLQGLLESFTDRIMGRSSSVGGVEGPPKLIDSKGFNRFHTLKPFQNDVHSLKRPITFCRLM